MRRVGRRFFARDAPVVAPELLGKVFVVGELRGRITSGRITEVEVAGTPVVRKGQLATGSLEDIEADARTEAVRLWERMRAL